ncbi:TPA: hypothetical protein ACGTQP_004678 [Salmonella enterica]
MRLANPVVCELLQYASNNKHVVELLPHYAVVYGFHGNRVFITEGYCVQNDGELGFSEIIYNGEFEDSCIITP